jgi:uncharacterized DUF497 family protein
MKVTFDSRKDEASIAKHGVSLALAAELEIPKVVADDRFDYGEPRFIGFGLIDGRPYCLAVTVRFAEVRAISLRRAHAKEFKRHVP